MYERMLNKEVEPTMGEMAIHCGHLSESFVKINSGLESAFQTQPKVVFPYGNHYGWGIGHYKKKKLMCNIFPEDGAFTVMIRLTNAQYLKVSNVVSEHTRKCIDEKYPCGDGGWLHYRVISVEHYEDIAKLLALKCQN